MGVFKEIVLLTFLHLIPELQIAPIEHIDSECSGNWSEVIAILTQCYLLAEDLNFNFRTDSESVA